MTSTAHALCYISKCTWYAAFVTRFDETTPHRLDNLLPLAPVHTEPKLILVRVLSHAQIAGMAMSTAAYDIFNIFLLVIADFHRIQPEILPFSCFFFYNFHTSQNYISSYVLITSVGETYWTHFISR